MAPGRQPRIRRYDRRAMAAKPAAESRSELVKWMGIEDANSAGFVHGGVVMRLCDEVAGIAGIRHSANRVVTAAVDRMTFMHPVNIGELLICSARPRTVTRWPQGYSRWPRSRTGLTATSRAAAGT